jgi:hypothetical protein
VHTHCYRQLLSVVHISKPSAFVLRSHAMHVSFLCVLHPPPPVQVFGCGHYYCDGCAQQALSVPKPTCPYCRKPITRSGAFR